MLFSQKKTDDSKYLQASEIYNWARSLIDKALQQLNLDLIEKYSTCGPAITLHIHGSGEKVIKVDLVPCIAFGADKWLRNGFRTNNTAVETFFIVPKSPKNLKWNSRYWRLSFQQQEREILSRKQRLKPALRLLKKARDTNGHHQISSYYLKTIILWEVEKQNSSLWEHSLSFVFMHLLTVYRECLKSGEIPYYWNKKNDLLAGINPITIENNYYRIDRIINTIDRNLQDPFTVAKLMLHPWEYNQLMDNERESIEDEIQNNKSLCTLL